MDCSMLARTIPPRDSGELLRVLLPIHALWSWRPVQGLPRVFKQAPRLPASKEPWLPPATPADSGLTCSGARRLNFSSLSPPDTGGPSNTSALIGNSLDSRPDLFTRICRLQRSRSSRAVRFGNHLHALLHMENCRVECLTAIANAPHQAFGEAVLFLIPASPVSGSKTEIFPGPCYALHGPSKAF